VIFRFLATKKYLAGADGRLSLAGYVRDVGECDESASGGLEAVGASRGPNWTVTGMFDNADISYCSFRAVVITSNFLTKLSSLNVG
jgi:hypothetical protein